MNDTLIFLVLAGIALIFKWLSGQTSADSENPEPPAPNERAQRPPAQSEEERVRRFLEALGQPPGAHPPPPVRPRTAAERRTFVPRQPPKVRRGWARPLPPLVTTPEDATLPPLVTTPPVEPRPIFQKPEAVVAPAPVVIAPRRAIPSAKAAAPKSLGEMLRSRENLRQVVVLREILGPPRGLQARDELRSF